MSFLLLQNSMGHSNLSSHFEESHSRTLLAIIMTTLLTTVPVFIYMLLLIHHENISLHHFYTGLSSKHNAGLSNFSSN